MSSLEADISARITEALPDATVQVQLDGNRALLMVTSAAFADMSRVDQQRSVYGCIDELIQSGELHAVTIRATVPE